MINEITASLSELDKVVHYLEKNLPSNAIVFLRGDLAAGKTTLTQAIAKSKGIESEVTSPTFSLQQCYGERLYHYDIYNQGLDHFLALGMLEELEKSGYHLIEWGDASLAELLKSAQIPTIIVTITKSDEKRRIYRMDNA